MEKEDKEDPKNKKIEDLLGNEELGEQYQDRNDSRMTNEGT